MPGRDGTGPMGGSTKNGRGLGLCSGANVIGDRAGLGLGSGYRRGLGRNIGTDQTLSKTPKELLQEQKQLLENRLDEVSKQLESL